MCCLARPGPCPRPLPPLAGLAASSVSMGSHEAIRGFDHSVLARIAPCAGEAGAGLRAGLRAGDRDVCTLITQAHILSARSGHANIVQTASFACAGGGADSGLGHWFASGDGVCEDRSVTHHEQRHEDERELVGERQQVVPGKHGDDRARVRACLP